MSRVRVRNNADGQQTQIATSTRRRNSGLLGEGIFGTDFTLDIEIRSSGAFGAFVCAGGRDGPRRGAQSRATAGETPGLKPPVRAEQGPRCFKAYADNQQCGNAYEYPADRP